MEMAAGASIPRGAVGAGATSSGASADAGAGSAGSSSSSSISSSTDTGAASSRFELRLAKEDFKFNAAHFVAHDDGTRERLHGHGYRVSVRLRASGVGDDGYVLDFGDVKATVRALCKALDERFLCPANSTALGITVAPRRGRTPPDTIPGDTDPDGQLHIACKDGSAFSFPMRDVVMLPVRHTSAEELARYLCTAFVAQFPGNLRAARVNEIEFGVTETPGQEAAFVMVL